MFLFTVLWQIFQTQKNSIKNPRQAGDQSWVFESSLQTLERTLLQSKMLLTSLHVCCIGHRHEFTRLEEEEDLIGAARCSTDILALLDVVLGL